MTAFVENTQNGETLRDTAQGGGRSMWKGGVGDTRASGAAWGHPRVGCGVSFWGEDTAVTPGRGGDGPSARQTPPSCSL